MGMASEQARDRIRLKKMGAWGGGGEGKRERPENREVLDSLSIEKLPFLGKGVRGREGRVKEAVPMN